MTMNNETFQMIYTRLLAIKHDIDTATSTTAQAGDTGMNPRHEPTVKFSAAREGDAIRTKGARRLLGGR
jgi:hypothetical protein